jgi:hypothetical protein
MNGHQVVHGSAEGRGIYLARSGQMSMGYAVGANRIFGCRGKPTIFQRSIPIQRKLVFFPSTYFDVLNFHIHDLDLAYLVLPGLSTSNLKYSKRLPPSTELGFEKYQSYTTNRIVYVVRYTSLVLPCYVCLKLTTANDP